MTDIIKLIDNRAWHAIANQYDPKILAKHLSFKNGMALAYHMLFNEERDDELSDYAAQFLQALRDTHLEEWSLDWRNDVFLGDACYITMKYQERYEAYKRAYEKSETKPSSLLLSLAGCYLLQEPPITIDEAEKLTTQALEKETSMEGAILLRGIYAEKKDQNKFDYWDKILQELEEKNVHTLPAWPDFSKFK